jgi:hypothetical protein
MHSVTGLVALILTALALPRCSPAWPASVRRPRPCSRPAWPQRPASTQLRPVRIKRGTAGGVRILRRRPWVSQRNW